MTKDKKKPDRPEVLVKLKKICIDSGDLTIQTKFGRRYFIFDKVYSIPEEEAKELIKVRTGQRKNWKNPECDLIIIEE